MTELSTAERSVCPPRIRVPRDYNAAYDLLESNLRAGRGEKLAYIDDRGEYSYAELVDRVYHCAGGLLHLGIRPQERVLLCLHDTIDFPVAFLGSILAGIVPVPVNTSLDTSSYRHMLADSKATALVVSGTLLAAFEPLIGQLPDLKHIIVSNGVSVSSTDLHTLLESAEPLTESAHTSSDDPCFWLYSSGSTGLPKGTIHLQSSLIQTAELYARPVLGLREDDLVFSAAKLFFAYGLGNALTFPLAVGATAVLMEERPTAQAVFARLRTHRPTIFFGVPTLYATMLASDIPGRGELCLRACVSAGEGLPRDLGERWVKAFGVDILDGIGSTEMLHIFLSNRLGEVCYGTTGSVVPGYEVQLVDESGQAVAAGEIGELLVCGPSAATAYWNNPAKTAQTFQGRWTRSGDKFYVDCAGRYVHAGRADDMLKVSGLYVSPTEVESALLTHPGVQEAAVIGAADADGLIKPVAYVVLRHPDEATGVLAEELKQFVKSSLAPHKYPRRIEFVAQLPRTATGKLQRFKLRDGDAARLSNRAN
jgi:benzoate-CoA ligase